MNPEIKAKWVAALRSGKYKQTAGVLRETECDEPGKTLGFCCLGVLCNLHAMAHPKVAATHTDPNVYLGETELLPEPVRKWAGLPEKEHGATVLIRGVLAQLTEHNDDHSTTFREIATAIEKQL